MFAKEGAPQSRFSRSPSVPFLPQTSCNPYRHERSSLVDAAAERPDGKQKQESPCTWVPPSVAINLIDSNEVCVGEIDMNQFRVAASQLSITSAKPSPGPQAASRQSPTFFRHSDAPLSSQQDPLAPKDADAVVKSDAAGLGFNTQGRRSSMIMSTSVRRM